MSSGTTDALVGLWGSSSSDVFAVGDNGTILHYDGSVWTPMVSGTDKWLEAVWGSSSSDVFALGGFTGTGVVTHYNGSTWTYVANDQAMECVWGFSPSDVFTAGSNDIYLVPSKIRHYNGTAWNVMQSGTTELLFGIWGSSSSDVFVVGAGGTILHYSGKEEPTSPTVIAVNPNQGNPGQTMSVTIAGTNLTGATAVSFGSGITVGDLGVDSSTEITAEITIDSDAVKGVRDVSVTTAWGTGRKTDGFSVVGGGGGVCSGGASVTPGQPSEMTTTLGALGLLLGVGYLLVRRGRRDGVWA